MKENNTKNLNKEQNAASVLSAANACYKANGGYSVIYADPPWKFGNRLRNGTKQANGTINTRFYHVDYTQMTIDEMLQLPIKKIAADDSALFMWSTDAHLKQAIQLIEGWGFTYKTIAFHWIKYEASGKLSCHVGLWTNKDGGEVCLLGTRGKIHGYLKNRKIRQLVKFQRRAHSQKPEEVMKRIELMFGNVPRLELFARRKRDGWHSWGNEIESDIDMGLAL